MFRQRTAIFRESTNTKDQKFKTPLQVSIALSFLKYKKGKVRPETGHEDPEGE
jgi:hypothetical protein